MIDIHLEKPYCTFDFTKFSRILNSRNSAEFIKAAFTGVKKESNLFTVSTTQGSYSSRILVDATGWRASVAEKLIPGYVHRDMLSFGIETEVPYRREESFHFFYEPDFLKNGVSWLFPCGEFARFGVASYTGETRLQGKLDAFLDRFHVTRDKIHRGFFFYCLKKPVMEGIFVVGCAQGQTLPLTGEGISRSITIGTRCGEIIQKRSWTGRLLSMKARKSIPGWH
ncbi:MAG: hypothetical protein JRG73_11925 [Deltaproteobacteria bacterium]|nr:hypothetical protein [Deltaproteobacteria bacterium]MBW2307630.1 hypothetical protein [Deltaproteobacteria bacterium]